MTEAGGAANGRGTYFFLSYAHSAPMPEDPRGQELRTDTDVWVEVFFKDLSGEVLRRARPSTGMEIGFLDQQVPPGADWKAALADALGGAQVFVPLYSPDYFSRSWSMRERESFAERLAASGAAHTGGRILPVLWTPVPPWDETPEIGPEIGRALELGADTPEYADNGMRALCMLSLYRDPYRRLTERLADRIVELAEQSPVEPSLAPALDHVVVEPVAASRETGTAFIVAVAAPTDVDHPEGRAARGYGPDSTQWRPFAGRQALPVADYAVSTAERLGLQARAESYADGSGLFAQAPGVLLVDPWVVEAPGGQQALRAATKDLPEWVVPLVIADRDDPQYAARGAQLADDVVAMLRKAGMPHAKRVTQVEEFVDIMPSVVDEGRRQYLRRAPVYPPAGPSTERPSLRPTTTATPIESGKQTND
ncbi:TIR-like protein FxsC [Phytohabitans kaempferiae]|uniref:TIR-like protein FxsC n=1 Tax=Phytohabitans kaempferiae TaxID=1620943 RepID=A0ABV6ME17_9ACTN